MFFEISFGTFGDEIQVHNANTCQFDYKTYLKTREQVFQKAIQNYPTLLAPSSLPQTIGEYLQHQGYYWINTPSAVGGVKKIPHARLRQQLRRSLIKSNFIQAGRIIRFIRPRLPDCRRIYRLRDVLKLMKFMEKSSPGPSTNISRLLSALRRYLKKHTDTGIEMVGTDGGLQQTTVKSVTMDVLMASTGKDTKYVYRGTAAKSLIISTILRELSEGLEEERTSLEKLTAYSRILKAELTHLGINPFVEFTNQTNPTNYTPGGVTFPRLF